MADYYIIGKEDWQEILDALGQLVRIVAPDSTLPPSDPNHQAVDDAHHALNILQHPNRQLKPAYVAVLQAQLKAALRQLEQLNEHSMDQHRYIGAANSLKYHTGEPLETVFYHASQRLADIQHRLSEQIAECVAASQSILAANSH